MEEFLKDYVEMLAEAKETELTAKELRIIVENLKNNDEMWDTFDSFIHDELDHLKGGE